MTGLLGALMVPLSLLLAPRPGAPPPELSAKKGSPAWKRRVQGRARLWRHSRPGQRPEPVINLINLHTGERLAVADHEIPSAALVNRFLRCRWTQRQTRMAPSLIRWVLEAAHHFGAREVHVVSGFRHPKFNRVLWKKGRQVARRSNHRLGKAVDFRLVGVDVERLFQYLKRRRLGGVGRYPQSQFVHLDTGRFRTWGGI